MGWSFRKSLKAGPFRINLSRSGIGGSFGVKGARISVGPRGTHFYSGWGPFRYQQKLSPGGQPQQSSGGCLGYLLVPILLVGSLVSLCLCSGIFTGVKETSKEGAQRSDTRPLAVVPPPAPPPEASRQEDNRDAVRTWTTSVGPVEAEFLGVSLGHVRIRQRNGEAIEVSISSLSADDRLWLENRLPGSTAIVSAAPGPNPAVAGVSEGEEQREYRTWTSSNGRFTVEATLERMAAATVTLRKRDGKEIKVDFEEISDEDQRYIRLKAFGATGQ